jgi:hypothetical protein
LISYLEANQGSTTYLVATTNSNTAAPIGSQVSATAIGDSSGSQVQLYDLSNVQRAVA